MRSLAARNRGGVAQRLLGEAGRRTRLARVLTKAGELPGITPYNWRLLKSTRRSHWLARRMPRPPWATLPPAANEGDEALCERLIAAYRTALDGRPSGPQTSGHWAWIYESRQRSLVATLDEGDAQALAAELASMFRKPYMHGLSPEALSSHRGSRLGARIWRLRTLDGLVSLAQALAVAPVDDPAMGPGTAYAFDGGLDDLVERLERALGFSIGFPAVGAPQGLMVGGRLMTMDSAEQIYTAFRLGRALRLHLADIAAAAPSIVEIGAGYGGTCLWLFRSHGAVRRYAIIDLPIVNVIQGYFLSRVLGREAVSLYGEEPARVTVSPSFGLAQLGGRYDALVNKNSMPEMPAEAALEYLRWARSACEGIFFSYNQESQAPFRGEEQGLVPALVEQAGGYSLLRRDRSWARPGYVEEVYAVGEGE